MSMAFEGDNADEGKGLDIYDEFGDYTLDDDPMSDLAYDGLEETLWEQALDDVEEGDDILDVLDRTGSAEGSFD